MKAVLTELDFKRAAETLRCDVVAIKAVCQVEAPKGGFLPDGQPTILFERHIFRRLTGARYDRTHPGISNATPGGYKGGAAEHARLQEAAALAREEALQSASWGKFQIMGFNYLTAGFPSVQSFINAMYHSEGAQLDAFVAFLLNDSGGRLARALREHRWTDFSRWYNGPNYTINRYDQKIAEAYQRFA